MVMPLVYPINQKANCNKIEQINHNKTPQMILFYLKQIDLADIF